MRRDMRSSSCVARKTSALFKGFGPHFQPLEGTLKTCSAKCFSRVGARGFEPPTSRSRTKAALTLLSHQRNSSLCDSKFYGNVSCRDDSALCAELGGPMP